MSVLSHVILRVLGVDDLEKFRRNGLLLETEDPHAALVALHGKVDLAELLKRVRVVVTGVGAPALFAFKGAPEEALRIVDHALEVESRVPARIEATSGRTARTAPCRALLQVDDLLESLCESLLFADDRGE